MEIKSIKLLIEKCNKNKQSFIMANFGISMAILSMSWLLNVLFMDDKTADSVMPCLILISVLWMPVTTTAGVIYVCFLEMDLNKKIKAKRKKDKKELFFQKINRQKR